MGISGALGAWNTSRADRLDRLAMRRRITASGEEPPEDPDFVGLLYAALAAEFQGYARDLHDECVSVILRTAKSLPPQVMSMFSNAVTDRRGLDSRNATTETIRQDFLLFGLKMWHDIQTRDRTSYPIWRGALEQVTTIRNSTVHSTIRPITDRSTELLTSMKWQEKRRLIEQLAVAMNDVAEAYLLTITPAPIWEGQGQ